MKGGAGVYFHGGISLQDAPSAQLLHLTVANNDSTATAGAAFAPGIALARKAIHLGHDHHELRQVERIKDLLERRRFLAMARAAGEVAPLMITGVVKLAPALPVDGFFPFIHLERKFMHLGFHIYDVGFQSPNVEAARPMVFTTTLLLIAIVATLNVAAILLRSRLRRRFVSDKF